MPIIFYIIFRTSTVQSYVAQKAANYLSKQLKTEISVGGLDITYYLNIVLEDITIKDKQKKILLYSKEIKIKVSDIKFKAKELNINNLSFVNTSFAFRKYADKNENNIKFLSDYFLSDSIKTNDTTPNKWIVKCSNLNITKSYFIFQDQSSHEKPNGIDLKNIKISKLNLSVKNINYNNDSIYFIIDSLSFKENKGLNINHLAANVVFSYNTIDINSFKLKTDNSDISADYNLQFNDINKIDNIFNNLNIKSSISPSIISLKDISLFVPELIGMDENIKLTAEFSGFLNDIKINKLICLYKDSTRFWGDISLKGLPDFNNTFINTNIKEFCINKKNIPKTLISKIKIPMKLNNLNKINLSGSFKGYYYDFVSTNSIQTNLGNINTDIYFMKNSKINDYEYAGKIKIQNLNLNKLLFEKSMLFGDINLNADIKGSGITLDDVNLNFKGSVDSLLFNKNIYNKINVFGDMSDRKFNGLLSISDENVFFDFKGLVDFNTKVPVINFTSNIKNADLYNLNFLKRDTISIFNTKLNINLKGKNIDDICGNIKFINTSYRETNTLYNLNNLEIIQKIDSLKNKNLKINSDFFDVDINGNFLLSDIANSFELFISKYLPSVNDIDTSLKYENQNFIFNVNLKNTFALSKLLYPKMIIANNSYIKGGFNTINNNYYFNAYSDLLDFNGIKFNNVNLVQHSVNDKYIINTSVEKIILKERSIKDTLELGIDSLAIKTSVFSDTVNYTVIWDDIEITDRNKGLIKGYVSFKELPEINIKFTDAAIIINDSLWSVNKNNLIKIDTSSININDFAFFGHNQQLLMDGIISENPNDKFDFNFKNFDISYFDPILNNKKVDVDGIINGSLNITDFYKFPNYVSDFIINDFFLNNQKLGDLSLKTKWDINTNHLILNSDIIYHGNFADTKPLSINGYYAPKNETTKFDFKMDLLNFKVSTISPFLSKFSSKLNGLASGNLRLYNHKQDSYLVGKIKLKRTEMKIDYLNITYSFADFINFEKNSIDFNNITIYDTLGNTAVLDGKFYHKFFKNSSVDIDIKPDKLSCLNLESYQNKMFFGKGVASGDVSIKGPVNDIVIDIKAKTERGTDISIPINFDKNIADNSFIKFTNKDDTLTDINNSYYVNLAGYNLLFDFDVTNDAQMQLFLPMQMGTIKGSGYGNIKMDYNNQGNFNIFGDYFMNKGSFAFSLQNMLNKHFTIRKGGYISWKGDPYDAAINLKAVYNVRASLSGLESLTQLDPSYYSKKVNVDCLLSLTGKISDPIISFSIELPNADDDTKQLIYSAIDTSNAVIMNEQMISLLVLNSFSFNSSSSSIAGNLGVSSFELLSNQLSNLLSKISDDFDIGVNYAPGDEISNEELEVALSTQLFNDRILIDGNFGVRGDKSTQKTSNLVGDVNVEVKVTKDGRLRVKAFNKSNDVELLSDYTPYTQGVGIFYRKEFDNFKEFITRKNKKKKKKKIIQ